MTDKITVAIPGRRWLSRLAVGALVLALPSAFVLAGLWRSAAEARAETASHLRAVTADVSALRHDVNSQDDEISGLTRALEQRDAALVLWRDRFGRRVRSKMTRLRGEWIAVGTKRGFRQGRRAFIANAGIDAKGLYVVQVSRDQLGY